MRQQPGRKTGDYGISWQPFRIYEKEVGKTWYCRYCGYEVSINKELQPYGRNYDQERAEEYLKKRDWQEASTAFTKVIEKFAWSANAWIGKGIAAIGLGLDSLQRGDKKQACQHLEKAYLYLTTPLETPGDYWGLGYVTGKRIAESNRLEFYQSLVRSFAPKHSASEDVEHIVESLLGLCNLQKYVDFSKLEWGEKLCAKLLRIGEFYYSLVKWLKPDIEDDCDYFERLEDAAGHLVFLASRSEQKTKTIHYAGISTNPYTRLEWSVHNSLRFLKNLHDIEVQRPVIIGNPDQNHILLRVTVKIKMREVVDGFKGIYKYYWKNYEKDFPFTRQPDGRWVCDIELPKKLDGIWEVDEVMKTWNRLPDTT